MVKVTFTGAVPLRGVAVKLAAGAWLVWLAVALLVWLCAVALEPLELEAEACEPDGLEDESTEPESVGDDGLVQPDSTTTTRQTAVRPDNQRIGRASTEP